MIIDMGTDTIFSGQRVTLKTTSLGHYTLKIYTPRPDIDTPLMMNVYEGITIEEVFAVNLPQLDPRQKKAALFKLHRQFAHPTTEKLVALLRDAGAWENSMANVLGEIERECEICKIYKRTPPRPSVCMPMASQFNERVAIDLKK